MAKSSAKKLLLPRFELTSLCGDQDPGSRCRALKSHEGKEIEYFYRATPPLEGGLQVNHFPCVIHGNGAPWVEACLYLLALVSSSFGRSSHPHSVSEDLGAFLRFLEEKSIDFKDFPPHKLFRPTYRYKNELFLRVQAGELASSTAKRRMGTVIRFYRWMIDECLFVPAHDPWKKSDRWICFFDQIGSPVSKRVETTDLSLKCSAADDPFAETINDGGKLKPLTRDEQLCLLETLAALGNIEMLLIHLFALTTGARIQTTLTLRVKSVFHPHDKNLTHVRLFAGPGTGIDTKRGKKLLLLVPAWLYERLHIYVHSPRACRRRSKAKNGNVLEQYLFLSERGAPHYQSKSEMQTFDSSSATRHLKIGQGIRQFIREKVLPRMRSVLGPKFQYSFHDLRATFGMNLTDHQLALVERGEATLHQVREHVKARMGHSSSAMTDRYLQYRRGLEFARGAQLEYELHLQKLASIIIGDNEE